MPLQDVIQRSFVSGEIKPGLHARADLAKYLSGLRLCRNLIVMPGGGATKRPGTRFVREVKDSGDPVELVPFLFEGNDQTYLLEFGEQYIRFYWHGAIVVSGGSTPYEVVTPYAAADLSALRWSQSADVITLTHPSYAPRQLSRIAHTNWSLSTFTTAPWATAISTLSGSAGAAGALTMRYVVTAAKLESFEETYKSNVATIAACAVPTAAAPNPLAWTATSGAGEYYVYCDPAGNGVYGFIGVAKSNAFNDIGFLPDFTMTPPEEVTRFASTDNYPRVVQFFQQRQWFGGTNTDRETVYGSQVGSYRNFATSVPLQDDDAVSFVLAGNQLNPVIDLVGLGQLLVLTDESIQALQGDESGAILPTAISPHQVSGIGSSSAVRPTVVGGELVYVQSRGVKLRALAPAGEQTFAGLDLTVFASHLFTGYSIVDMAFQLEPHSVVWLVRSDGALLGLTYMKEQEVWAWHRHDVGDGAVVERVRVIPDTAAGVDVLYLVVRRTIDGSTVRYIEKLEPGFRSGVDALADAFYVDCGLSYSGSPISTVTSGLAHLEGEVVAVLGDGAVLYDGDPDGDDAADWTVTSGTIALGGSYSKVSIGLRIHAQLETLSMDVEGTSVRAKYKRIPALVALLEASDLAFEAGPDEDNLIVNRKDPWLPAQTTVDGSQELSITAGFNGDGRVVVRHTRPLPFTLLGLIPSTEFGGGA